MLLHYKIKQLLSDVPLDFGGGCSIKKATLFAWLIKSFNLKKTIDIGVYRGRSFFPQVWAHKNYTGGLCLGIDPYSTDAARQADVPPDKVEINKFIDTIPFEAIYTSVLEKLQRCSFEDHGKILKVKSIDAFDHFESYGGQFDMIHIDGNHDGVSVMQDVKKFLSLVRPGGFVILDDVSWPSVKPSYEYVASQLTEVFKLVDKANDFSVFLKADKNGKSRFVALRLIIAQLFF